MKKTFREYVKGLTKDKKEKIRTMYKKMLETTKKRLNMNIDEGAKYDLEKVLEHCENRLNIIKSI